MPGRGSPRLMCRVTDAELEHFDREVKARRSSRQRLMRETLGGLLGSSAPVADEKRVDLPPRPAEARTAPEVASERPLPTPAQIAGRTGNAVPAARAIRLLAAGKVEWRGEELWIDGRAW